MFAPLNVSMPGRWFRRFSLASLILCVMVCALWGRSFFAHDNLRYGLRPRSVHEQRRGSVQQMGGRIIVGGYRMDSTGTAALEDFVEGWDLRREAAEPWADPIRTWRPWGQTRFGFGTFGWDVPMTTPTGWQQRYRARAVMVPHAALVLLLAATPAIWLMRWRRGRKRARMHLCAQCGYDLRATPSAEGPVMERCPECGRESNSLRS
jgi:hypothetical protein